MEPPVLESVERLGGREAGAVQEEEQGDRSGRRAARHVRGGPGRGQQRRERDGADQRQDVRVDRQPGRQLSGCGGSCAPRALSFRSCPLHLALDHRDRESRIPLSLSSRFAITWRYVRPCTAPYLSRRRPDAELHPGRPPARRAAVHGEPACAAAGGRDGTAAVHPGHARVDLTEDGEAMLGFARTILQAHERAAAFFTGTRLRGRLRFGASEDFVLTRLPEILESFRRDHPEVELELTVELSGTLHRQLAAGRLDLVLAKRRTGDTHGELVWQDTLTWIGAPQRADRSGPSGAAGPLPAAGHHPGPRPGGAGGARPVVADRLYEYEPERTDRGGPCRAGRDGAHPRPDPAGTDPGAGQGGAAGARRCGLRPAARPPPGRGAGGGGRARGGDPGGRRPAASAPSAGSTRSAAAEGA